MKLTNVAALVVAGVLLCSQSVIAKEKGDWFARAGATFIDPKSDNGELDDSDIGIEVDSATMFSFEVAYMMTDNLAVELLASLPFEHDVSLDGIGEVGSVKHLPPTLSVQYHFNPTGKFQPYVGAGLNVTIFFSEDSSGALAGADIDAGTSFGLALQAGVDVPLNDRWFLNASARWVDIESDIDVDGDEVGTAKIDPLVYSLNVGYNF